MELLICGHMKLIVHAVLSHFPSKAAFGSFSRLLCRRHASPLINPPPTSRKSRPPAADHTDLPHNMMMTSGCITKRPDRGEQDG